MLRTFQMLLVSKGAKIRNRYNQAPHLTQDTNGKVTNSQFDTTNESQEESKVANRDRVDHRSICSHLSAVLRPENSNSFHLGPGVRKLHGIFILSLSLRFSNLGLKFKLRFKE